MKTPAPPSRRDFLRAGAAGAAGLLIGCESDSSSPTGGTEAGAAAEDSGGGMDSGPGAESGALAGGTGEPTTEPEAGSGAEPVAEPEPEGPTCDDLFADGTYVESMPFLDEGAPPMNAPFGAGLDGREYFDLAALTPNNLLTPIESFYIRTREPDLIGDTSAWTIEIDGLVKTPLTLTMADLEPLIEDMGVHVLECSGNGAFAHFGMLSATEWRGVPFQKILDLVELEPGATRVRTNGFDEHSQPSGNSIAGNNWIFTFDQLLAAGAMLATHMGGQPLLADHGFPVRLHVPGWYGCTSAKWLDRITFVDDSEPSTEHMKEYASRTHQIGIPSLAKDFLPATLDQTAMPVRVEKWTLGGEIVYRIVGILWGGYEVTDALQVRVGFGDYEDVEVCPPQTTNQTWTLWSHLWKAPKAGEYEIACRIDDPSIVTKRLDTGFYIRYVEVDQASS